MGGSYQAKKMDIIKYALEEDIGAGDVTTNSIIPENQRSRAIIKAKEQGVICGLDIAKRVFQIYDSQVRYEKLVKDGDLVQEWTEIAIVEGSTRSLLTCERTALNFLQHMSGIATRTNAYVKEMGETKTQLLDTRKTVPGMRVLEKYAVKCGGGTNHRMGLYDMIMIKDNHIAAAGSIVEAIRKARALNTGLKIEVECKTLDEVVDALTERPDIIMLDNMKPAQIKKCIYAIGGKSKVELSGGITKKTLREYSVLGADYVSVGELTRDVDTLDISMDIPL